MRFSPLPRGQSSIPHFLSTMRFFSSCWWEQAHESSEKLFLLILSCGSFCGLRAFPQAHVQISTQVTPRAYPPRVCSLLLSPPHPLLFSCLLSLDSSSISPNQVHHQACLSSQALCQSLTVSWDNDKAHLFCFPPIWDHCLLLPVHQCLPIFHFIYWLLQVRGWIHSLLPHLVWKQKSSQISFYSRLSRYQLVKTSSQQTDPNAEICMESVLCNISKDVRHAGLDRTRS